MAFEKLRRFHLMALRTDLVASNQSQGGIVRTMCIVTDGAIFPGRRMQCTVTPELGHFTVATEAKGRLVLDLVPRMGRTVSTVAEDTLLLHHRFMLVLETSRFCFDFSVTVQTDLTWLALDKLILFGTMRNVTGATITLGKRRVGSLFSLIRNECFMAGQAEFTFIRCFLKQTG
jgi:hypothetical protein